jgi:D-ribose pyranose/furanose isomerase RbsD
MNIVFAYHNGDAELALLSAKAITSFGINMRHKATVCATNDSALLFDIIEELKKSFPEVGRIIAQDGYNGWPLGPNQMFSDAAAQCYAVNEPWMFWEPDCVPMKQGWADDLEAEFRKEPAILGHQYEGGMATNGKNIYKMIVGSAIYPPNFLDFCPSARSLDNYNLAYRSAGTIPEPWDVRCRWNFMAIGRDCPLLRTYWKSVNYHWKDGKIVFFAEDPEAQAVQGVTCPDRVISSKAVVIHGCKDGSLHKMAIAGFPIPSDSTGLDIPSNSMGLEQGVGQNAPTLNIPDQEQTFSNVSVGDEIEIIHIPVREYVQNINNDAQKVTVCDKTSLVMPNSPDVANCRKVTVKRKNKSPSKAKKRRNLSPEERQRRSEAMKAILARKAERKAQGVV